MLIAKEIAKELNIQYEEKILQKVKDIKPQSLLSKEEREKNIKGAYKVNGQQKIQNKKILLIDDIYTTGSTVNECSNELKEAGASEIDIFTIAKD